MANEKRLIDVNALVKGLELLAKHEDSFRKSVILGVVHTVNAQTTVDAVEVVHGQWLVDDYDSGDPEYYSAFIEVHCSKCGYSLGAENGQYGWYYGDPFPMNYCPNCGAKMDGDGND